MKAAVLFFLLPATPTCARGRQCSWEGLELLALGPRLVLPTLQGHKAWVSDVALSPSHDKIVTTSGEALSCGHPRCFEPPTTVWQPLLPGVNLLLPLGCAPPVPAEPPCTLAASCAAPLDPLPRLLKPHLPCLRLLPAAAGDGTAIAYSLETGDMLCLLEGHSGPVQASVVTRKGRQAWASKPSSMWGAIRVWFPRPDPPSRVVPTLCRGGSLLCHLLPLRCSPAGLPPPPTHPPPPTPTSPPGTAGLL